MEEELEAIEAIFEDKVQIWTDESGARHLLLSKLEPLQWAEFSLTQETATDVDIGRGLMTVEIIIKANKPIEIDFDAPWLTSDLRASLLTRAFDAAARGGEFGTAISDVITCLQSECNVSALITEYKQRHALGVSPPTRPPDTSASDKSAEPSGHRLLRIDPGTRSVSFTFAIPIHHGRELIDRKSVFQAHLAAVCTHEQVVDVLNTLNSNNRYAKATHNMICYRLVHESTGLSQQDHDSDGESGAGSKMQWLMDTLRVKNVLVIVSRWYGGIHLGTDRFKHINALTRAILEEHNYVLK